MKDVGGGEDVTWRRVVVQSRHGQQCTVAAVRADTEEFYQL